MNRRRLVPAILVLAALLRLYGIGFVSHHPDERTVFRMAAAMVLEHRFEPGNMSYGSLTSNLQALVLWVVQAISGLFGLKFSLAQGRAALVVARLVSAAASVATVAMTARLARVALRDETASRLEPALAGWLAPLLMAISFLSVQCAHYSTVDSLMALLSTSAVVTAFRAYDEGRLRHFLLAGLLAGLAMATKYTGALSALPLAAVPLLTRRRPRPILETAAGLAMVGAGFLLGMPYALIKYERFLKALSYESKHYQTGGDTIFAVGPDTWRWNLEFLFYSGIGPGISLMAVFGVLWLLVRWRSASVPLPDGPRTALLLSYPVVAFLFVSRYQVRFDRNLLPLLPFLCTAAAVYAEGAWQLLKARHRPWAPALVGAMILLAIAHPLSRGVIFDWQLPKRQTKDEIKAWKASLPLGSKVANHGRSQSHPLAWYQRKGFDYIVMSSHSWEPVAAFPDRYPKLYQNYRNLFAKCPVVATFRNPWFDSDFFVPHSLLNSATVNIYHGPTLMVLKVPPATETGGESDPDVGDDDDAPEAGSDSSRGGLEGIDSEASEDGQ